MNHPMNTRSKKRLTEQTFFNLQQQEQQEPPKKKSKLEKSKRNTLAKTSTKKCPPQIFDAFFSNSNIWIIISSYLSLSDWFHLMLVGNREFYKFWHDNVILKYLLRQQRVFDAVCVVKNVHLLDLCLKSQKPPHIQVETLQISLKSTIRFIFKRCANNQELINRTLDPNNVNIPLRQEMFLDSPDHLAVMLIMSCVCKYGSLETLVLLLKNYSSSLYLPLLVHGLHKGIEHNRVDTVEYLLNNDILKQNNENYENKSFKRAIIYQSYSIMELLLKRGNFDPNRNEQRYLDMIIGDCDSKALKILLQCEKLDLSRNNYRAILFHFVRDNIPIMKILLQDHRVNTTDLFFCACVSDRFKHFLSWFLNTYDPTFNPSIEDNRALIMAASHGAPEIMRILLKDKRIDINAQNCAILRTILQSNMIFYPRQELVLDILISDPRSNIAIDDNDLLRKLTSMSTFLPSNIYLISRLLSRKD